jgi:urease accessory protein
VGPHACAQLTTPGAAKWYRSAGETAQQHIVFRLGAGAVLEWLLQEAILFDGAIAGSRPAASREFPLLFL